MMFLGRKPKNIGLIDKVLSTTLKTLAFQPKKLGAKPKNFDF
jgi:hypothetical protein